jgi:hypothetical protein
MALAEFAAIEAAYRALTPLDGAARHRALAWLTSALNGSEALPGDVDAVSGALSAVDRPKSAAATVSVERTRRAGRPGARAAARVSDKRGSAAVKPSATGRSGKSSSARKSTKASSSTPAGERAYRRMPDADEVLGAYRQVGTVSGLAEHFGVPRHTVQGWARRLRREGYTIGRS